MARVLKTALCTQHQLPGLVRPSAVRAVPAALGIDSRRTFATTGTTAHISDVTAADFEQRVLQADRPVIVDFHAHWCGPCRVLGPMLESAVRNANGNFALAKVNVDEEDELAARFNISSIPHVVIFFQGKPVGQFTGLVSQAQIDQLATQLTDLK